jgi:pyruvate,water dikinase
VFPTLDGIGPGAQPRVGGKAYNCARLKQAGFPVPDALVVPADATDADVRELAGEPWFDRWPPSTLFAVRSSGLGEDSAGHSFAGIHETRLNVPRAEVVDEALRCRRSTASEQARAYREARQLSADETSIAVMIQTMVPAVRSGVAFTMNPVTDADELVIDSVDGLGEALVGGQVTPDEEVLPKDDDRPLARLLVAIERHYGAPQDVEWCYDGSQYWIVQSRPITTCQLGLTPLAPDIEWTRANLAEVLPEQVSPQALAMYEELLERGEREFFGALVASQSELGPIIKAFHGRLYFNLSQLRHVTSMVGAKFADTLRTLGHPERIHPDDEVARRPPLGKFLHAVPTLVKLLWYDARAGRIFREHEAAVESAIATLDAVDPSTRPDREIAVMFDWWLATAPQTLKAVFVMSSVQYREDYLRKVCRTVNVPFNDLVYPHLAAGERSVSSQQAYDLVALADVARTDPRALSYLTSADGRFAGFREALAGTVFLDCFERFLTLYGHRGHYESDWALPRLREDPAPALFAVRAHLAAPPRDQRAIAERQEAEASGALTKFEAALTPWQRLTTLRRVRATLRRLKQQYVWRERVRSDSTRVVARIRAWHLVLADRFVARGWIERRDDYFLLHLGEIQRACADAQAGPGLRAIAAGRAATLAAERDLQMPLFMRESELPALMRRRAPIHAPNGHELTGLCVSPGSVEGEVVVLDDPGEFASMKRGAILVTRATDPSWTPLFTLASGVVVEVGGMLSHASTIAREYGLPALANVKDATKRLRTGERVLLDASGERIVRRAT